MSEYFESMSKLALSHVSQRPFSYSLLLSTLGLGYSLSWVNKYLSDEALNHGTISDFNWDEEIVLVTGGAGGIGGEVVQKMAKSGTTVIVLDVMDLTYTPSNCFMSPRGLSQSLTNKGSNVHFYKCDITDHAALKSVAERIRIEVGEPSIVVANAGICRGKALLDASERDVELTIGVNTLGLLWTVKTFLPSLVKNNHGHLLIVASVTGYVGSASAVDYCASKAAAISIYEGLHTEIKHIYKSPAVIGAAIETATVCRAIYNGDPTANSTLNDNAFSMKSAASQLSEHCLSLNPDSHEEKELADLATKCRGASQQLLAEVESITSSRARNSLSRAVYAGLKARMRKRKVEDLEKRLLGYKEAMEMQILVRLYERSDRAQLQQREVVKLLSGDLQYFLKRLAEGHTKMQDLLRSNDRVIKQTQKTEVAVKTHVTTELRNIQMAAAAEVQDQRFLHGLKFPEMNKRLNDITPADETTFTRIFRSYDTVANRRTASGLELISAQDDAAASQPHENHLDSASVSSSIGLVPDTREIDMVWQTFVEWLRSDEPFFWIQGKPGSGKSTLIKFLINHESTQALLDQWKPGTMIMSHFFWKVGSGMQNNLKGLFCSLIYQTLQDITKKHIIDHILRTFSATSRKSSIHDWSLEDLRMVMISILGQYTDPICIFIDGLDEVCHQDGPSKLLDIIQVFKNYDNIKLCVACRGEWLFRERFKGMPTIKLEDLTEPDMRAFVHKELLPFLEAGAISSNFEHALVRKFVHKAQGVFLWLSLALRSVKGGIEKDDREEEISSRLEQLPGELEDLYTDMWTRLNRDDTIYRQRAAHYLKLAIARQGRGVLAVESAFILMSAGEPTIQKLLLDLDAELDVIEIEHRCRRAQTEISTRCVGLLEFMRDDIPYATGPDRLAFALDETVEFTHRTVLDFLTDSEAGQRILSFDQSTSSSIEMQLTRGILCSARVLLSRHKGDIASRNFPWAPVELLQRLASLPNNQSENDTQEFWELLSLIERFYDKRILAYDDRPLWYPSPVFLALIARVSATNDILEEFVVKSVRKAGRSLATEVLRDMWFESEFAPCCIPSSRLVQKLMELGADIHSVDVCLSESTGRDISFLAQGSALSRFLLWAWNTILLIMSNRVDKKRLDSDWTDALVLTVAALIRSDSGLGTRTVWVYETLHGEPISIGQLNTVTHAEKDIIIIELDHAFLLRFILLWLMDLGLDQQPLLQSLCDYIKDPFASIRYIWLQSEKTAYIPISQEASVQYVIPHIFHKDGKGSYNDHYEWKTGLGGLVEKSGDFERLRMDSLIEVLAKDGIGLCLLKDTKFRLKD
ncbi:Dehydrogenase RED2 [Paramyrothecium foliicola]|nr:Dehydrogenase RED2 [Paramyrothecium foliicola]